MSIRENETGQERLTNDDHGAEREMRKVTILGLGVSKRSLGWTIAGVIIAAVGLSLAIFRSQESGPQSQIEGDSNIAIQGDRNSITNNYFQKLEEFLGALPSNPGEPEIREAAKKYLEQNPEGDGPWPFVVVADPNLGLKVRTSGLLQGVQVGSVAYNTSVWAECKEDTGFNPQPGDPNGSVWYQIRWPNDTPTTQFLNSSPGDRFRQWVYGGLIVPIGHNGHIPTCK